MRTPDLVARHSGDALAVILPGTPLADARRVVERIQEAVSSSPLRHGETDIALQVVAGIAPLVSADGDTGEVGPWPAPRPR